MEEASELERTRKNRIYQESIHYWNRGQDGLTDNCNKLNITGSKPLHTHQRSFNFRPDLEQKNL